MKLELIIDAELTKSQLGDTLRALGTKVEYSTSDKWQNLSVYLYENEEIVVGKFRLTE